MTESRGGASTLVGFELTQNQGGRLWKSEGSFSVGIRRCLLILRMSQEALTGVLTSTASSPPCTEGPIYPAVLQGPESPVHGAPEASMQPPQPSRSSAPGTGVCAITWWGPSLLPGPFPKPHSQPVRGQSEGALATGVLLPFVPSPPRSQVPLSAAAKHTLWICVCFYFIHVTT